MTELSQSQVNDILRYICQQFGGREVALGESGTVVIPTHGVDMAMFHVPAGGASFVLYSEVGHVDESDFDRLCDLLYANHPDRAMAGISLSLVPASHAVAVSGLISFAGVEPPEIYESVTTFAEVAAQWSHRLKSADPGAPADPAAEGAGRASGVPG
jgi:hypothetical protein